MLRLRMRVALYLTEEYQAQETDQSSDGFTINDVVDINDQHNFNIFSMYV